MELNGVEVVDTFAEAFPIVGTRLIITAASEFWSHIAAYEFCGFATSVIACDAEAAIERALTPEQTPDGRTGISVLVFAFDRKSLESAVSNRVGQCVLTCPTTACYSGLTDSEKPEQLSVGSQLRYFGDGFQVSKKLGSRRLWRVPVMDGEFVCEDRFGTSKGVAGGNLLICGDNQANALAAAETAVNAMQPVPDSAFPFPGGIVRSGSKVGSRYKKLKASTNDAYCPTLMGSTTSALPQGTGAVYEIVIDGLTEESVRESMRAGLHAASQCDGVLQITAGNYGGKLGKYHFHLKDLI
ncbi:MAG: formylmethanofuran--tetrahydromethanopterin N-formyltransferase [Planctomycetaceae bacterium]|nr:formylmethanofuran--tetrahydromethanopterin N-formyltransferase [Planctomycetaceae bacterium]